MTPKKLGQIQARNGLGQLTKEDARDLIDYIDKLEDLLDEGDQNDAFGSQGWRYHLGLEE